MGVEEQSDMMWGREVGVCMLGEGGVLLFGASCHVGVLQRRKGGFRGDWSSQPAG